MKQFKILVINDEHGMLNVNELGRLIPEQNGVQPLVLSLGDVNRNLLNYLCEYCTVLFVRGNHDYWQPECINGECLEQRVVELNIAGQSVPIGGFGGSFQYKEIDKRTGLPVLYSDPESVEMLDKMEQCDILITHDSFKGYRNKHFNHAHQGLLGINHYIHKCQPKLHLFGHFHTFNFMARNWPKTLSINLCGLTELTLCKDGDVIKLVSYEILKDCSE